MLTWSRTSVDQDAREVKTKFSKTFTTFFFPVGDEIREIVAEWVSYLRESKLWGNDDPLFPATCIVLSTTRQFEASGLNSKSLEHRLAYSGDISRGFHPGWSSVFQSAQL